MITKQPWEMTRNQYAEYIDSLPYNSEEWQAITKWNNEQSDLYREGKRKARPTEKLVHVYQEEVILPRALSAGKTIPPAVLADYPKLAATRKKISDAEFHSFDNQVKRARYILEHNEFNDFMVPILQGKERNERAGMGYSPEVWRQASKGVDIKIKGSRVSTTKPTSGPEMKQTPLGQRIDQSITAKTIFPDTEEGRGLWRRAKNKGDLRGIDTRRATRVKSLKKRRNIKARVKGINR